MKFRQVLFVVMVVFVFGATYFGEAIQRGAGLGFNGALGALDYVWMALATIAGVMASVLVSGLRTLPQDQRVHFNQLKEIALRPGCLIALFVSPISFYGFVISVSPQFAGAIALLSAFQNGFFWEQVLRSPGSQPDLNK